MRSDRSFKYLSIAAVSCWLTFLALLPFSLVILGGFLTPGEKAFFIWHFTFSNYLQLFQSAYFHVFIRSFYLASITTFFCLLLGYPFAYIVSKLPPRIKPTLIFLLIIPFWTSSLIRIYSIVIIIRAQGMINAFLLWLGVIHSPIHILFTQTAVFIGLVYALLPFMIMPLYANLEKFDWRLVDAARDLGASKFKTLFKIVIPITTPGIVAGIMLVLLPAMTMFYIPDILGGAKSLLLGNIIKNEFIEAHNWPLGSAISVTLTIIMALLLFVYWRITSADDRREFL